MFNVFPYGLQYKHDMGSTMSGIGQQHNRDSIAIVANAIGAVKNESSAQPLMRGDPLQTASQFVGTFSLTSTATVTDLYPGILRAMQDMANGAPIIGQLPLSSTLPVDWKGWELPMGLDEVEEHRDEIFDKIVAVASGEKTKSEQQDIGDEEFCPWSIGPVL